jgi:thiol-disulfide isomerase/thioredoxin
LKEALANAPALGPEKSTYEKKLVLLDEEVKSYQRNLVLNEKQSLAAAIVKANIEVEIPEFTGTKEETDKARFQYYRDHYFDNLDLSDARLLRTPVLFDRVDRYINKYTVQVPDSIVASLDLVLTNAFPSEETYKFLLIHYLNEYAKSKFVGMDAMYVHLVDNYYANGKAPWVEKEQLDTIVKNANELRPLLIGKIAPNITVYKEDLTPVSLHSVESPYTVLFFWAPDCGHCQKSMPGLVDFYKEYKAKGVEILAVCAKLLEKEGTCWDAVKEKNMESWINTSDKYLRSKFGQVYNVKSTPQVYVLDHKKEILTKQVAVEKLGEIMDLIFAEAESNDQ